MRPCTRAGGGIGSCADSGTDTDPVASCHEQQGIAVAGTAAGSASGSTVSRPWQTVVVIDVAVAP